MPHSSLIVTSTRFNVPLRVLPCLLGLIYTVCACFNYAFTSA